MRVIRQALTTNISMRRPLRISASTSLNTTSATSPRRPTDLCFITEWAWHSKPPAERFFSPPATGAATTYGSGYAPPARICTDLQATSLIVRAVLRHFVPNKGLHPLRRCAAIPAHFAAGTICFQQTVTAAKSENPILSVRSSTENVGGLFLSYPSQQKGGHSL